MPNFEAASNIDAWPPNEAGKATQAAVFGVGPGPGGKGFRCEILWTAKFPDLEPAIYWAAKKEVQLMKGGQWPMASRVVWQHDMTPEQAVAVIRERMRPHIAEHIRRSGLDPDELLNGAADNNGALDLDLGMGPLKPVDFTQDKDYYVEIVDEKNPDAPPIFSGIVPGGAKAAEAARLTLDVLGDSFDVCRLAADEPAPGWATEPRTDSFCSVTRTRDELSVICPSRHVPGDFAGTREQSFRALKVRGPLEFGMTGVAASLVAPLALAQVSVLPVATFETDYLVSRDGDLDRANAALRAAGHRVETP